MSNKVLLLWIAAWLLHPLVGPLCAQETDESWAAILNLARAAPPPLSAEGILRLIERVPEAKNTLLAEQAIQDVTTMAISAKQPYPKRYIGRNTGYSFELRSASQGRHVRLDSVSLLSRATLAMLRVDPQRAIELAEQALATHNPIIPNVDCKNSFMPNLAILYTAIEQVIRVDFSQPEREAGKHLSLVETLLWQANHSTDLPALGRVIIGAAVNQEQAALMTARFTTKLQEIRDGDPELTIAMDDEGLTEVIVQLTGMLRKFNQDPTGLVRAYRSFLVEQAQIERCAHVWESHAVVRTIQDGYRDWARTFNRQLQEGGAFFALDINPIDRDLLKPKSLDTEEPPLTQLSAKEVQYRELVTSKIGNDEQKESSEWDHDVRSLLGAFEAWDADNNDAEEAHFVEKCELYKVIFFRNQAKPVARAVADSLIQFLSNNPVAVKNPSAWVGCFDDVVDAASDVDRDAQEQIRAGNSTALKDVFIEVALRSPDRIVVLFAQLAKLEPSKALSGVATTQP